MRAFRNMELKRIFGPEREGVKEEKITFERGVP
jgi:hypothetical protein